MTYRVHFWYAGASLGDTGHVFISRSSDQGHGHRSKKSVRVLQAGESLNYVCGVGLHNDSLGVVVAEFTDLYTVGYEKNTRKSRYTMFLWNMAKWQT